MTAGKIVFFAGGTGHPYFSTDTGVVLRAIEMEADEILLAKAVDGVYDSDPKTNPQDVYKRQERDGRGMRQKIRRLPRETNGR